jgi:predicted nucleic acid-binding protein
MNLIFWDTNLFIYLIEENPDFAPRVRQIRSSMVRRGDRLCTSSLTVGETLVGPYMRQDDALAARYRKVLSAARVQILPFDLTAADRYARIRARRPSIARADAMQLACAAEAQVNLFITNDRRLSGHTVPGIQFIVGLENCPL